MNLPQKFLATLLATGLITLLLSACSPQAPAESSMSTGTGAASAATATAQTAQGSGVIKQIDPQANRIVIDHQPIASLDWPQMTMGFKLADPTLLQGLEVGQTVRFELQAEGMNATITAISSIN